MDDSVEAAAPRLVVEVDRQKAALLGVSQAQIVQALSVGLQGSEITYVHSGLRALPDPGAP